MFFKFLVHVKVKGAPLPKKTLFLRCLKCVAYSHTFNSVTSWHHTASPCHTLFTVEVKLTGSWKHNRADWRRGGTFSLMRVWADRSEQTEGEYGVATLIGYVSIEACKPLPKVTQNKILNFLLLKALPWNVLTFLYFCILMNSSASAITTTLHKHVAHLCHTNCEYDPRLRRQQQTANRMLLCECEVFRKCC